MLIYHHLVFLARFYSFIPRLPWPLILPLARELIAFCRPRGGGSQREPVPNTFKINRLQLNMFNLIIMPEVAMLGPDRAAAVRILKDAFSACCLDKTMPPYKSAFAARFLYHALRHVGYPDRDQYPKRRGMRKGGRRRLDDEADRQPQGA